jgi:hypothetical protein
VLNPTLNLFKPRLFKCDKPKSNKLAFKEYIIETTILGTYNLIIIPNKLVVNDFLIIGKGVKGEFI